MQSGANPSAPNTRYGASAGCRRRLGRHCGGADAGHLYPPQHRRVPPDDAPALEPRADAIHLFSEAGRLAFADRGVYVADSDFVQVNVAGAARPGYLKQRAQLIGPRSMGGAVAGVPPGTAVAWSRTLRRCGTATSHISVIDDNGAAVAMTTTIEDVFGSRLMVAASC